MPDKAPSGDAPPDDAPHDETPPDEAAAGTGPVPPRPPGPGERMPTIVARIGGNPRFVVDTLAGRWIVFAVIGSAARPGMAARLAAAAAAGVFDDSRASLFVATQDRQDEAEGRLADRLPGLRIVWDADLAVARAFGLLGDAGGPRLRPAWIVIDPGLTIRRVIPLRSDGGDLAELLAHLRKAPPPPAWLGYEVPAPVLILPEVFEPAFCDRLVGLYETQGGAISGFMRDEGGQTVAQHDPAFKVRRDCLVVDPGLIRAVQARILCCIVPQIERVFYFRCTRMERYLVACYDAAEGGHFRPHRDNTTRGTAHRRFAVSINLNEDFAGGEISFPEYSPRGFKAPRGGAVVFSCAMLHAVGRVTAGRRYAFLPFLYDDAAARLRQANAAHVPSAAGYRA